VFRANQIQWDSAGGWNTFWSWHELNVGTHSPAIGRSTWCGGVNGCLQVKWVGARGQAYWVDDEDANGNPIPLLLDHWYDIKVRVKWSHLASEGVAEVWVDGRTIFGPGSKAPTPENPDQLVPPTFATLWAHTDGRPATVHQVVGHYLRGSSSYPGQHPANYADPGDDTTYIDNVLVGPTEASIGG
jgi:Polysaccharide lyase